MIKRAFAGLAIGAAALLPAAAFAQQAAVDVQSPANPGGLNVSPDGAPTYRATDVLGMSIRNEADQEIGKVEDLVLDSQTNQVLYAVVSYGGFQELGDRFFAVPMQQFVVVGDVDRYYLRTALTVDRLKEAPSFARGDWRTFVADPQWRVRVNRHYGVNVGVGGVNVNVGDRPDRPGTRPDRPDRPDPRPNLPNPGPDLPRPQNPDRPNPPGPGPGVNPDRPNPNPPGPRPDVNPNPNVPRPDVNPNVPRPDVNPNVPPPQAPNLPAPRGPQAPNVPGPGAGAAPGALPALPRLPL